MYSNTLFVYQFYSLLPFLLSFSGADKRAIAYVDKPDLMNTEAEKEERGGEERRSKGQREEGGD